MLDKVDLRKYLIYATGEVFLVVIGILIALQINNWNEERKARNLEHYILSEMLINLKNDLQAFETYIKGNLARQQSQIIISNFLEGEISYHDSLEYHFANIMGGTFSSATQSAYENLKSSGLNLIRNDTIRQEISNLYENRYSFVRDLEIEYDRRFQSHHLYQVVLEEINTIKMWERAKPRDIKSLLNHHKFKETLRVSIFNRGLMINTYKGMKSRIERLIENIENELSKKNQSPG